MIVPYINPLGLLHSLGHFNLFLSPIFISPLKISLAVVLHCTSMKGFKSLPSPPPTFVPPIDPAIIVLSPWISSKIKINIFYLTNLLHVIASVGGLGLPATPGIG